jgi:hypothetical protein
MKLLKLVLFGERGPLCSELTSIRCSAELADLKTYFVSMLTLEVCEGIEIDKNLAFSSVDSKFLFPPL